MYRVRILEALVFLAMAIPVLAEEKVASDAIFDDMENDRQVVKAEVALLPESKSEFATRMAWFTEARYGMFIHFGPYALYGGEYKGKPTPRYAEWILCNGKIPKGEYEENSLRFNPIHWDAEKIVTTAKQAGMKYIVITTKHHDGFCLWDAPGTDYDFTSTPFKRDLLQELADSCHKHGIRFGTYYSILDWHHPTQDNGPIVSGQPSVSDPEKQQEYIAYMKAQLKDLIDRYDTDIIWFDGDWMHWWTMDMGTDLYNYLRELKPSIIINNRVSKRKYFKLDFGTPEQVKLGKPVSYLWESCYTINHSWGFKKRDTKWKSSRTILEDLVDINSKGGNYLLNIGPRADGTVPPASVKVLLDAGKWVHANADAIYGTEPPALPPQPWGRITRNGNRYFLHVFKMPAGQKIIVKGLSGEVVTVSEGVSHHAVPQGIAFDLQHMQKDALITVVAVEIRKP